MLCILQSIFISFLKSPQFGAPFILGFDWIIVSPILLGYIAFASMILIRGRWQSFMYSGFWSLRFDRYCDNSKGTSIFLIIDPDFTPFSWKQILIFMELIFFFVKTSYFMDYTFFMERNAWNIRRYWSESRFCLIHLCLICSKQTLTFTDPYKICTS